MTSPGPTRAPKAGWASSASATSGCRSRWPSPTPGSDVVGLDVAPDKVAAILAGDSYVEDVAAADLERLVRSGRLVATTEPAALGHCDALLICVPTPLGPHREPGSQPRRRGRRDGHREPRAGCPPRPRIDDLARHDPGDRGTHARSRRPDHRPGCLPRLQPGEGRSGQHPLGDPHDAQGRGRPDAGLREARQRSLRAHLRHRPPGLDTRNRRRWPRSSRTPSGP